MAKAGNIGDVHQKGWQNQFRSRPCVVDCGGTMSMVMVAPKSTMLWKCDKCGHTIPKVHGDWYPTTTSKKEKE